MIDQKQLDEIRARVTSAASDYMIMSLVFGDTRDLLAEVECFRAELRAKDGLIGSLRLQVEELEGREGS